MRVAELASGGIGVVYVGKTKAPAGGSSGRYSAMIKG
jgi:hypothetical protein